MSDARLIKQATYLLIAQQLQQSDWSCGGLEGRIYPWCRLALRGYDVGMLEFFPHHLELELYQQPAARFDYGDPQLGQLVLDHCQQSAPALLANHYPLCLGRA